MDHKYCIVSLFSVSLLILPPVMLELIGVLWSVAVFIPRREMFYTLLINVPLLFLICPENKITRAISLHFC